MLVVTFLTHTSEIRNRRYCRERLIIFLFIKEFIHLEVWLIHIFMRHVIFVPRTAAKLLKGYIITPISSRYKTSNHQCATFEVSRKTMSPTFSTIKISNSSFCIRKLYKCVNEISWFLLSFTTMSESDLYKIVSLYADDEM